MKQRGRTLEKQIERVFTQLNSMPNIMAIRLEIKRTYKDNVHLGKQPFDYLVLCNHGVWAFDAKECSQEKWYPSKAKQHQKDALQKIMNMRGASYHAGFVVEFTQWRGHPGAIRWITDFVAPATVDSGIPFDWEWFYHDWYE